MKMQRFNLLKYDLRIRGHIKSLLCLKFHFSLYIIFVKNQILSKDRMNANVISTKHTNCPARGQIILTVPPFGFLYIFFTNICGLVSLG